MKKDKTDTELFEGGGSLWDGRKISEACSLRKGQLRPKAHSKRKASRQGERALFGVA